jgi:hypothetical protein
MQLPHHVYPHRPLGSNRLCLLDDDGGLHLLLVLTTFGFGLGRQLLHDEAPIKAEGGSR